MAADDRGRDALSRLAPRHPGRRVIALGLAAVLVTAGCLSGTPNPSQSPPASEQATPPDPVVSAGRPRVFSFVVSGEPTFFSPVATDAPTRRVNSFLYIALSRLDDSLFRLAIEGVIPGEEAFAKSNEKDRFTRFLPKTE